MIGSERRIQPAPEILDGARRWLGPVREALGPDFLAAYLTGSVLTQGFDPKQSRVNVLVIARALPQARLDGLAAALAAKHKGPGHEPLFLTRRQIEKSLDVFPIEWLDIQERHLLLEGEDVVAALEVPRTWLRLQCEHELRGRQIRLRQAYLAAGGSPQALGEVLATNASGFGALFRTLLRLRGEDPPADGGRLVERVAELYRLEPQGLLGAHLFRYSGRKHSPAEMLELYRGFLGAVDRLVEAIDQLDA